MELWNLQSCGIHNAVNSRVPLILINAQCEMIGVSGMLVLSELLDYHILR